MTHYNLGEILEVCWMIIFWGMTAGIVFLIIFRSAIINYYAVKANFVKEITKGKSDEQ